MTDVDMEPYLTMGSRFRGDSVRLTHTDITC